MTLWRKESGGPLRHCMRIFSDDHEMIAIVGNSDKTMIEIDDNATLIAAAPELADALRELYQSAQLNSVHYSKSQAAFKQAGELLRRIGEMSEQPDPGPGWRLASGDDWKDLRCEWWRPVSKKWISRGLPGEPFRIGDFYRIPIDPPPEPQPDVVNAPPHYRQGDIECIDAIRAALTDEEFRGFCKGNVIGYVWRERHKGGDEDIDKSIWYLERLAKEKTE